MTCKKGCLIVFEGNDGAGKTTALNTCAARLKEKGYPVLVTREPGGAPMAEKIRSLLLEIGNDMDPKTEALLYAASRREHLVKTILPAIEAGQIILCDRFLDSSLAYQGYGRRLGREAVEALNDFGLEGFRPDLVLFFALDVETEARRMAGRGQPDRLDLEDKAFHERVREGFEALNRRADDSAGRIVVDAAQSREAVADFALAQIEDWLKACGLNHPGQPASSASQLQEALKAKPDASCFPENTGNNTGTDHD